MTKHLLLLLGLSTVTLHATEPSPEDSLRQGLFEEEANQNLDKAAGHYRAVIAAHDRQRALTASATFRLGEIARKNNDTDAAAAAFLTVTERFPEQAELARLSRENLAALGIKLDPAKPPAAADAEDQEIARLKELARNSPDLIDGAGADGWRPIHHAAAKGWGRVISYLLENKADPNEVTITERLTPLHLAAIHGHLGAVKNLLAAKADPNLTLSFDNITGQIFPPTPKGIGKPQGRWTALDLAILFDRRETALALIEADADIEHVGPAIYGSTINTLVLAIRLQRDPLAKALIEAGASLDAVGSQTPLVAAVQGNPAMVAPLLTAGADPNLSAPLYSAAYYDRTEAAKLLIEAGADVKTASENGETPLHHAANAAMADLLIANGADPNARDTSGLTPLDHVAKRGEVGPNIALIETLLKHGATVADPLALLGRTSEAMLPWVGEHLVYPKTHRPDAILLSVSGKHGFNQERPPSEPIREDSRIPRLRVLATTSSPVLITLETRPSPASPPPSLPEALREAFPIEYEPGSIRILRRGANGTFESILEWQTKPVDTFPTEWPALKWGDILDVRNSSGGKAGLPRILDFAAQISSRTVTYKLGELDFPKTISRDETFWLDRNSCVTIPSLIPPKIQELANLNQFLVHRKGFPEPINLDFTEPTETRFRLLDGDTVEMSWDFPKLHQTFHDGNRNHMISLVGQGVNSTFSGYDLVGRLMDTPVNAPLDFRKICILRRADGWKPEMVDFKAWLEQLPPKEKWEKEALAASAPKLNPGDILILIENHDVDAEKAATEIRKKVKELYDAIH